MVGWVVSGGAYRQVEGATELAIERADGGRMRLDASRQAGMVFQVEVSDDPVGGWIPWATTHEDLVDYPDGEAGGVERRYYRVRLKPIGEADDWKHQVHFPEDSFLSIPSGYLGDEVRWVKFAIMVEDPVRVIFQDSGRYLYHYDFATQRLEDFRGMTPGEFDRISLYRDGQRVVLGAVLYPPPPDTSEYGIQLVGNDVYPRDEVRTYFERVRAVVAAPPGVQALYLPTFEQAEAAEADREYYADHGIRVSSAVRWIREDEIYASGWAVGRLRFIPADEIAAAYADGRLAPGDILVTDAVPAEIPFVAGVIGLAPATPNSHVAILARSFGVPFVYPAEAETRQRVMELDGAMVALRARELFDRDEIKLLDLEGELSPSLVEALAALKAPPKLEIQPKAVRGEINASTDDLTPSDIRFFGGKAANFGFLRRAIPTNSLPAITFSFDLWDGFLMQARSGGGTLASAIYDRLGHYTYPPEVGVLRADLEAVRTWIEDESHFDSEQQTAIINALAGFDPERKIRFRSSTNVEDTENFTGAGLYDSYSGCLADDLDADTVGPSHCDPLESRERGVFRALRKVYASFFNENAFLERLRYGVDSTEVGMAVLVHHSFPDSIELANGVATLEYQRQGIDLRMFGEMVSQEGAVPVTNPEGNARPEVVRITRGTTGTYFNRQQTSDLVPLGGYVLDWDSEYRFFADLFYRVAQGYAGAFAEKQGFRLDFEYKKSALDGLVVKQVRELPRPDNAGTETPFLLNEPGAFTVFQGERADIFSNHRLKSQWQLETRSFEVAEAELDQSIFTAASHEYVLNRQRTAMQGAPPDWPEAEFQLGADSVSDLWTVGEGDARREMRLKTSLPRHVTSDNTPLLALSDLALELSARYATPQPALNWDGTPTTVTEELVILTPVSEASPSDLPQERRLEFTHGTVTVEIHFFWPEPPGGASAGYTAPLVRWDHTRITGLTREPIELRGYFSQTYRPGHHNFTEEFIFEPALEPGLGESILAELAEKNVRLIHLTTGLQDAPMRILGFDDAFRNLR